VVTKFVLPSADVGAKAASTTITYTLPAGQDVLFTRRWWTLSGFVRRSTAGGGITSTLSDGTNSHATTTVPARRDRWQPFGFSFFQNGDHDTLAVTLAASAPGTIYLAGMKLYPGVDERTTTAVGR
jgi:hypothetical protein